VFPLISIGRQLIRNPRPRTDAYREFGKAVGLGAHGVGIGAVVYLRRIIESLIEEAHQTAKSLRLG
jgi:hypothetical protein